MQHNIFTSIRSMKIMDGCKSAQVHALKPAAVVNGGSGGSNGIGGGSAGEKVLHNSLDHSQTQTGRTKPASTTTTPKHDAVLETLLPCGLPVSELLEPSIEPSLKPLDLVETLAGVHRAVENCTPLEKSEVYLEQCAVVRSLPDPKLFRRSLREARRHAIEVHMKVVLASWLRYERREDELVGSNSMDCCGRNLECPKASLVPGYDHESVFDRCSCFRREIVNDYVVDQECECECSASNEYDSGGGGCDSHEYVYFCVGDSEIRCRRYSMATLSRPFETMLCGGFIESSSERINFSLNCVSVEAMVAVEVFSRTKRLRQFPPNVILEMLSFANKFCCEEMKHACDMHLASLVLDMDDAVLLIQYGLEETAHLLVAACLQVFLRELPGWMQRWSIMRLFCSPEGRDRLALAGHVSFVLYYFLSQVSMEEEMRSNTTLMLLERLGECAVEGWQKQLAYHQLGVVMLERKEYKEAQHWFEAAVEAGHVYSLVGVARAKFKRGHVYLAYKIINSLIEDYKPVGWMYQERSLYCTGKEKLVDLVSASELDPTLSFPYKYRAVYLVEENKIETAISEIDKIIGFKVSPDCLELRAWFLIAMKDYEGALRDVRAILTLDPNYMMFYGNMHGGHLVELLRPIAQQWSQADCWMQLYDRWSSVDDIGSLAVVHKMLENDPGKSILRFRQSLLLLRLNSQKAAMHSLRLARNHSSSAHERLVYEGWILYDTGYREEALAKAEESISIQRSFEAFFLKAYALADSSLDSESSKYVINLLEEALRCPSDGLRKGQALNNLGSVYVDCGKLDLAADCYKHALNIKHTRAHQGLARVYHLKEQHKAAYDEMTKLMAKARNNASAYEKRSEYCDRDMAKSDLSLATQLDPLRTYPYRYRAAVLMDDHQEAEAIAELSRAINFKPDLQLLHLRAAFHDSMGDYVSTVRDCEAALCLDPSHAETLELCNKAWERINEQKNQLSCFFGVPYGEEGEDNLDAMDFKRPRKLNFNAPLLSTKRFGFSGVADTSCSSSSLGTALNTSVPFSWEQAPGKPKTMKRSDSIYDGDIDTPRLRPPPCLWHPLEEEAAESDVYNSVLAFDQDDGCDGDDDDNNKNHDVFSDAMDVLSLSEALDIMQQSETAHGDSKDGLRLKLAESNGGQSPTYMINRFLHDANALVASSAAHFSNDSKVCGTCIHEKGSTGNSYASSPKGCGLEFLFSWLMKNKLCAIKSPVLPSSTNVQQKHLHRSKHMKHRSSVHKSCTN
ncbi:Ethylene-overproduction protein 1, partial [Mucuna pruriens]